MSILEAMSCGKPIVASNVGGIPEILGNGEGAAGMLVENDVPHIVCALSFLLEHSAEAARLAYNARMRYEATYSADRMWHAYLSLYRALSEV